MELTQREEREDVESDREFELFACIETDDGESLRRLIEGAPGILARYSSEHNEWRARLSRFYGAQMPDPTRYAIQCNALNCLGVLLERMDADARDDKGGTALIFAARHGSFEAVEALLRVSDPMAATPAGFTALMASVMRHESLGPAEELPEERAKVIGLLAQACDPEAVVRVSHGLLTALDIARRWGYAGADLVLARALALREAKAIEGVVPSALERAKLGVARL